jgi:hypothetical protein
MRILRIKVKSRVSISVAKASGVSDWVTRPGNTISISQRGCSVRGFKASAASLVARSMSWIVPAHLSHWRVILVVAMARDYRAASIKTTGYGSEPLTVRLVRSRVRARMWTTRSPRRRGPAFRTRRADRSLVAEELSAGRVRDQTGPDPMLTRLLTGRAALARDERVQGGTTPQHPPSSTAR